MAFYSQFPAIYAYHPMAFPTNQDFYAMYPGSNGSDPLFYEPHHANSNQNPHKNFSNNKSGANRKESTDSGISAVSRKTSNTSTISNSSVIPEEKLETKKEEEEEETPYVVPDDDLCEKIVQQVEFYFSDANITKDKFLLKHVKRNKEGFVSLKLISSFKRVKHLSKDWRQVAEAIERKSQKLEVNDLKTKVRRLAELPEYDETTPSRTVVALNLPLERPTIEGVAEIFSKVGDIVLIRILRPGNPIPADIKPFVNKHPEMVAKVTALVEFERTEFALRAVKDLSTGEDIEDGMKVMELIPPPSKSQKNKKTDNSKSSKQMGNHNNNNNSSGTVPSRRSSYAGQQQQNQAFVNGNNTMRNRRISLYHNMKFEEMPNQMTDNHGNKPGLNPNAPTFQMQRRISRPHMIHPFEMLQMQHQQAAAAAAMAAMHSPVSPWVQRRMMNEVASSGLALPPNVIRLPRGPTKGTKGFNNWCRSRMTSSPPASASASAAPTPPTLVEEEHNRHNTEKKSHAVPIISPVEVTEEEEDIISIGEEEGSKPPTGGESTSQEQQQPPQPRIIIDNTNEDDDDSGNEDEGFSDPDDRRQGEFNERTR